MTAGGVHARSTRLHYRDMLVAARKVGSGRGRVETALEFAGRLSEVFAASEVGASRELTDLYARARYGEEVAGDRDVDRASPLMP